MTCLLFTIGHAVLFFGGEARVRGASSVARHFHLSPMVIGLTIVAVGNSVSPNVFNIFGILGLTAVIAPIPADPRIAGVALLAAYGGYLFFMA